MPGLHAIRIEDVEITVEDGLLTLRGEELTEKHRTEFRYGTFARCVRLPAGAKGDKATGIYQDVTIC